MQEKDYQAIENGRRAITIRTALELAQVFDVELHDLFLPPSSREPRLPGRPRPTEAAERGERKPRRRR